MQPLQWEHRPDGLRAPALICAFKGWNDAADAASSAIQFVGSGLQVQRFATIDPEEFYDFQATRPRGKMAGGRALRGTGAARATRPDPARRQRALVQVADVQQDRDRARRGARHPARV